MYFSHYQKSNILYRMCGECKHKVEKVATECAECKCDRLVYKYNCPLTFSDSTGSLTAVFFDNLAQSFTGRTAMELSEMQEEEIESIFECFMYKYYLLTV